MEPERQKVVLLVEDDDSNREALSDFLRDEGYEVAATANGAEALDYLRSSPAPGLILLDLMMPVMNAWEFRAEQRRHPALAEIPVILLSAGYRVEEEAKSFGAAGVLRKPPDLEDLLAAISQHCR
jgi:CheY-like chemotaxis protein